MISTMFKGAGRIALWLASMLFLAALAIFVLGSFMLTWPILRLSPRDRKIKATVDAASSLMTLITVLGEKKARMAMTEALGMADREGVLDGHSPEDSEA